MEIVLKWLFLSHSPLLAMRRWWPWWAPWWLLINCGRNNWMKGTAKDLVHNIRVSGGPEGSIDAVMCLNKEKGTSHGYKYTSTSACSGLCIRLSHNDLFVTSKPLQHGPKLLLAHACAHKHKYTHTNVQTYICMNTCSHANAQSHKYTHACTNAQMYTTVQKSLRSLTNVPVLERKARLVY